MRNSIIILALAATAATSCGPGNQYTITGQITGIDTGKIYLQKREAGEWSRIDSGRILEGNFIFTGTIGMPEMWYLAIPGSNVFVPVFVEHAGISVNIPSDSIEGTIVTGSVSNDTYNEFLENMEPIDAEMSRIYKEYRAARDSGDEAAMAKADSLYQVVEGQQKTAILEFAKTHNTSVVAPYLIIRNAYMFELPEMEEAALAIDTGLNASSYLQELNRQISILQAVQIGKAAPDFKQNDTAGNPVTLSSLEGKFLLVDFWASWCGPCRAENPNVVEAWKKYNAKGFDVLGVSLDKDHEKWIAAIRADNLTWNHVSDLKYWNNEVSNLYGVRSIPSNVLLDRDGIIIARNLRGEDLQKKLEELLGTTEGDGK